MSTKYSNINTQGRTWGSWQFYYPFLWVLFDVRARMASLGHPTCCLGLTCTPHESWRCPLRGERSCRDVRLGGQENVAVKGSRHVYPDDSSHKLYTLNVLLVVIVILCCIITAANLCIVSNNTRPSKVWIITALCVCVCVNGQVHAFNVVV